MYVHGRQSTRHMKGKKVAMSLYLPPKKYWLLKWVSDRSGRSMQDLIREALDRLLSGRTSVVIAHRLSTIQHSNRILVFHKGRLREQGSHQELLLVRGIYYRLYQLQYKEQELGVSIPGAVVPGFPQPPQPLTADD